MTPARLLGASLLGCVLLASAAQAKDCRPLPPGAATLVALPSPPGMHSVDGPLADFDPCHRSVDLNLPWGANKPPLMIIAHGGSGLGLTETNLAQALRRMGVATLVFDAYRMNGFNQDWQFWATRATNESRQRMIYKAALGAYRWALTQDKIDATRIYLHGVSNGAAVVANLAAEVDPRHVRGVFAEGMPGAGLGLPEDLKVPVRLVHGKLDNYAGRREDEWRWLIQERCMNNGLPSRFIQPKGNAWTCNFEVNPRELTPTPLAWFEEQKAKGADIEVWWYENAAHGMFLGPIQRQQRTWGQNDTRYAWTGGDASARDKFLADFRGFLARQP